MPPRKPKAQEFPAECCGVCKFSTVPQPRDGDDLICWAEPPKLAGESNDSGSVEATWVRGAYVAPQMPACIFFKPRMHG